MKRFALARHYSRLAVDAWLYPELRSDLLVTRLVLSSYHYQPGVIDLPFNLTNASLDALQGDPVFEGATSNPMASGHHRLAVSALMPVLEGFGPHSGA